MSNALAELHILGSKTAERIVRAEPHPEIAELGFALLGVCHAERPYSMSTSHAYRAFVMTCVGGRGRVWIDGRWEQCRPGESYLCPKGGAHAYETLAGHSWHFVWSLYDAPPHWLQWRQLENRRVICDHALALKCAIEGLYREVNGPCEPEFTSRWAEIIHSYWRSTAEGRKSGSRLGLLWERVDSRLVHPWTIAELAKAAGVSGEHLRRLCLAETGRSPIEHLTHLRMRRAEALLQTRRFKVAAVAEAVGYTPFAFTSAFRKWAGCSPTERLKQFVHQTVA